MHSYIFRSTIKAINQLCFLIAPLITILFVVVSPQFNKNFPGLLFRKHSNEIVHSWNLLLALSIIVINCIYMVSGILTTVTFTLMMQCSQGQPLHLQSTNYTVLTTCEVLGKLLFMAITGFITDHYGYQYSYAIFSILAWMTTVFLVLFQSHLEYPTSSFLYRHRSFMSWYCYQVRCHSA